MSAKISQRTTLTIVLLACVIFFASPALASVGDRLPEFKTCLSHCVEKECNPNGHGLPLYMRLLFWTCPQNCDYVCQHLVTASRIHQDLSIEQFHGKWPFLRMLGIQEPASVLFSVLNFIPHYYGLKTISKLTASSGTISDTTALTPFLVLVYKGFALVGMNAWVWSSVFHVRDFVLTERLDYFSAGLTVTYGFFTATVRVFRLDLPKHANLRYLLILICITAYVSHVSYLSFVTFSYSYNMLANVVVGLLQNTLWIYHSISTYQASKSSNGSRSWKLWPGLIVLSITLAMSLELFDFPPILGILDAHALWHAGTVLPTMWWYAYMKRDIKELKTIKQKE
ncbi:similar to Saccharomyces cerevisiae YCR044C PER1 Protein of the endoplasmic reticulum [Geotrichum candidum]|uniref:Post-GPI attachment to proteins factor 3 n=2 Tax=Geotrichum candidum TaxID=1173061 RepID=A0A0J9XDP9_GEOCN|nr:similar to Saccharomyces cerevisiae YCR044C PER1 Protein of the endoplasmic reticulum [Geotrichum candidum]